MAKVFADFDVARFWEPSEYALEEYVGAPLTDEAVVAVERELGYKHHCCECRGPTSKIRYLLTAAER